MRPLLDFNAGLWPLWLATALAAVAIVVIIQNVTSASFEDADDFDETVVIFGAIFRRTTIILSLAVGATLLFILAMFTMAHII